MKPSSPKEYALLREYYLMEYIEAVKEYRRREREFSKVAIPAKKQREQNIASAVADYKSSKLNLWEFTRAMEISQEVYRDAVGASLYNMLMAEGAMLHAGRVWERAAKRVGVKHFSLPTVGGD